MWIYFEKPLSTLFRLSVKICYSIGLIIATVLGFLWYFQESLLFHPHSPSGMETPNKNPEPFQNPAQMGMEYEDVYFSTSDGVKLHGWLIKQENVKNAITFLFFQGNAGNIGLRLPNIHRLYKLCHTNIFIISYRGYGNSQGSPSEEGLYRDAEAALNYITARSDIDSSKLFVFGRSIGGAVALDLVRKYPEKFCGVIVENTFTCLRDMAYVILPCLRLFSAFIAIAQRVYMDSIHKVPLITTPILYISGARDTLVPPHHLTSLHDASLASTLRKLYIVPNGTHNTTWRDGGLNYFHAIQNFMKEALKKTKTSDEVQLTHKSVDFFLPERIPATEVFNAF